MFEVAELKCSKANQRNTAISGGGEDDDKEDEVNYERRGSSGRRVHVIFVINVISSAVLLISCGFVRGVTAQQGNPEQQQQQFKLPATTVPVQLTSSQLLGSLQPDQEAYVFTSSFDTERDRSECWFGWRWSICTETGFLLLSHS